MWRIVGAVLGFLALAGPAGAQARLVLAWGQAHLPPGDWQVRMLPDGAQAERVLGPTQRLSATMRLEPGPGQVGEPVEQRLERRVEAISYDAVDRDLLEERARAVLNLGHRNDVVIPTDR